jgi:hypothetical protein
VTEGVGDEIRRRYNNECIKPIIIKDVVSGEVFGSNSITELCNKINGKAPHIVNSIKKNRIAYGRYMINYK